MDHGLTGCLTECEIDTAGGGCFVLATAPVAGYVGREGKESIKTDLADSACFWSSAKVGTVGSTEGVEERREDEKGDSFEAMNQVAMIIPI